MLLDAQLYYSEFALFFHKTMVASFKVYNFVLCIYIINSYVKQRKIFFLCSVYNSIQKKVNSFSYLILYLYVFHILCNRVLYIISRSILKIDEKR